MVKRRLLNGTRSGNIKSGDSGSGRVVSLIYVKEEEIQKRVKQLGWPASGSSPGLFVFSP